MADRYVNSAATGNNDGTSKTDAWTSIESALTNAAAGERVFIASTHDEAGGAIGANKIYTPANGTAAGPVKLLSINWTTGVLEYGSQFKFASGYYVTIRGFAYWYGCIFDTGNSTLGTSIQDGSNPVAVILENCKLKISSASSTTYFLIGPSSASTIDDHSVKLIDPLFEFGNAGQHIRLACGINEFSGNAANLISGATIPTILFKSGTGSQLNTNISGIDFSSISTTLFNLSNASGCGLVKVQNCKLNASVTLQDATIAGPGGQVVNFCNCDSDATNYRMEHYKYQGSIKTETTTVLTGGASDGTTTISWNMTTLATGPSFAFPLESPEIAIWNETTGSAKTVTVEILHDSVTNLTDADVWLEVSYLGTSGYPLGSRISDRKADILATAVDQTDSSATWTTTGLTNPNTQKLSVSFTPQEKGYFQAKVVVAKENYTVYVDPKLTVS